MPSEVPNDPDQPALAGLIPTQTGPPAGADWDELMIHRPRLLALARSCGCPAADVPDVVQEALLRVALRPPALPERSLAFLSSTVRRLVTDRYRDRQRQQHLTEQAALQPQPVPGPEEHVCDHAEGAWLHTQTVALRPREREVLLGRAAGFTTAQIALELGTTLKTVEHLTQRARRALQAIAVVGCALVCLAAGAMNSSKTTTHRYLSHPSSRSLHHVHPAAAVRGPQAARFPA